MDTRLKDKVAIVTGGARGIGAAFCEGLAEAGAKVVVSDVLDGSPVAERLGERQRPAIYVRADVTSKASVDNLVADTVREFGTVDILVNNAGLFADLAMKPFLNIDEDEWDRVMKVNVRGTFQCAKAVAPVMMEKKKGRIVNIASGTAFKGTPNLLHYVAQGRGGVDDALAGARARTVQYLRQCHRARADHERGGRHQPGLDRQGQRRRHCRPRHPARAGAGRFDLDADLSLRG